MSFMNRLKALTKSAADLLTSAFASFQADPTAFKPAEFTQDYMKPLKPGTAPQVYRHGTPQKRSRIPGAPHPAGMKLVLKGLDGTIGNHGMVR